MTNVYLICGLPCSGKTFFARRLAADSKSLYLSLDQLLTTLHGQYSIETVGHLKHVERVIAARVALWNIALASLAVNVSVVIDDGFFFRKDRERYKGLCAQARAHLVLYYLDTSMDTIKNRLTARNQNLPSENFLIDHSTLEMMKDIFEPPSDEEEPIFVKEG